MKKTVITVITIVVIAGVILMMGQYLMKSFGYDMNKYLCNFYDDVGIETHWHFEVGEKKFTCTK